MLPTSPPASSIVTDNAAIRRHPFFGRLRVMFLSGKLRAIWSAGDLFTLSLEGPPLLRFMQQLRMNRGADAAAVHHQA